MFARNAGESKDDRSDDAEVAEVMGGGRDEEEEAQEEEGGGGVGR